MKIKLLLLIISMITISCLNKKIYITNENLNILLSKSISKYYQTKDKKYLLFAYDSLYKNEEFIDQGLVGKNTLPIISLLINLKKYDELEKLLINNTTINNYNRLNTLNTVMYLKLKDIDKERANSYIQKRIITIKEKINKTPTDSLLYVDYFTMKMFLVGKEKVLKDIDSMEITNKNYSNIFYKNILKESIENYSEL